MLGNLMHFDKDLVAGFFHFPLKEDDINKLLKAGVEERKKIILDELLPPDKFDELKKKYLWQTLIKSFVFMQTDLPFWQKILNSTYSFQIAFKHSKATFPEIDQKIIGSNVIH
jgi:hypothetical protein